MNKKYTLTENKINYEGIDLYQIKALRKEFIESVYTDPKYDSLQKYYIKKGIEKRIDVSVYADPKFDRFKMNIIKEDLEKDLDARVYTKPEFDTFHILKARCGL